jgi:hypothetical protein
MIRRRPRGLQINDLQLHYILRARARARIRVAAVLFVPFAGKVLFVPFAAAHVAVNHIINSVQLVHFIARGAARRSMAAASINKQATIAILKQSAPQAQALYQRTLIKLEACKQAGSN